MDLEYDFSSEVVSDEGNNDDDYGVEYDDLAYYEVMLRCFVPNSHVRTNLMRVGGRYAPRASSITAVLRCGQLSFGTA